MASHAAGGETTLERFIVRVDIFDTYQDGMDDLRGKAYLYWRGHQ